MECVIRLYYMELIGKGGIMKKLIIILFLFSSFAFGETTFNDIETHWGNDWITKIVSKNITSGYPDGTFRPDGTVTVNEFITFTIKALQTVDHDTYRLTSTSSDWAEPFRHVAISTGIIYEGQFDNFNRAIKREEMASIIIKANAKLNPMPQAHGEIANEVYDFYLVSDPYVNDMLQAIAEGFISGKSEVNSKMLVDPKGTATRGETAVLIVKLLEKDLRTPLVLDIPSTTFKSTRYNGPIKEKIDMTYYAAKNTEGKYVTEVFDIQHYFESFDHFRIDANYSYFSNMLTIDFKAKDAYEEFYTGSFWSIERNDIMFEYSEKQFAYGASPYFLLINASHWQTIDYDNTVDYIKGEYGEHVEWMFEYFFEEDKDIAINTFYSDLANEAISKVYIWNGRTVKISGKVGSIMMWFDEKVD